MNLIHFQGLNCYHDCVISLANYFGLHYPAAFATLWSETDFGYDPYHRVYLTKRMLTNLEALGAKVEALACPSQEEANRNLLLFHEGAFMIVGMDAFYIPWNPFYRTFHAPHYFIAQNTKAEMLLCFDPTYNKKNEQLPRLEMTAHTFEICRISRIAEQPLLTPTIQEAREIVRTHPNTRAALLSQFYGCVNGKQKDILLLAKYIDTMICNRYLYRFFLESQPLPYCENHLFLNNDFFWEWKAVKNGLYKASISKSNEGIINDMCGHFNHLIDVETAMAATMIGDSQVP